MLVLKSVKFGLTVTIYSFSYNCFSVFCMCGVRRRCVRVSSCVVEVSGPLGRLGGFGSSPHSSPAAAGSRPVVRYFLDLSSVKPVPLCSTLHGFPYSRVFYNGVSGPPQGQQSSSIFSWSSFCPDAGGPVFKQSRSILSVCLPDRPFPSRNPAFRCQFSGPLWPARIVNPIENGKKAFLPALTHLLAMIGSPLTRSSDNSPYPSRYTRL